MLLRCPVDACGWQFAPPPRTVGQQQLKLAGLDRGKQSRAVQWSEADTEHAVDQGAAYSQWLNLSTVHRVKFVTVRCPKCHAPNMAHCSSCGTSFGQFRPFGKDAGYGASPGVPDKLIAPWWLPDYLFIGAELKGSQTPFSCEEQKELAARRRIAVCRDWDQVTATVKFVQTMLAPILKAQGR